jgi:hypothetical protein
LGLPNPIEKYAELFEVSVGSLESIANEFGCILTPAARNSSSVDPPAAPVPDPPAAPVPDPPAAPVPDPPAAPVPDPPIPDSAPVPIAESHPVTLKKGFLFKPPEKVIHGKQTTNLLDISSKRKNEDSGKHKT